MDRQQEIEQRPQFVVEFLTNDDRQWRWRMKNEKGEMVVIGTETFETYGEAVIGFSVIRREIKFVKVVQIS